MLRYGRIEKDGRKGVERLTQVGRLLGRSFLLVRKSLDHIPSTELLGFRPVLEAVLYASLVLAASTSVLQTESGSSNLLRCS